MKKQVVFFMTVTQTPFCCPLQRCRHKFLYDHFASANIFTILFFFIIIDTC